MAIRVAGLSKTALRNKAGVSSKQFRSFQKWGLLPERPDNTWIEADLERLRQIRDLETEARSLHRRVILLQDARWPVPGDKLRQAMIDTIPSIEAPKKKMRALYRALQVRYGYIPLAKADTARVPSNWSPPKISTWEHVFRWPTEKEIAQIANSVWADTQSLVQSPLVIRSGLLANIPVEEIAVLLMTHQLTLTPQIFRHASSDTDPSRGTQ